VERAECAIFQKPARARSATIRTHSGSTIDSTIIALHHVYVVQTAKEGTST
jgi:hypothetical protein